MKSDSRSEVILRRLTLVCIVITSGISSVAIIGWALNWLLLARISPSYIPMAPSTALSFIVLSGALLVQVRQSVHPAVCMFAKIGTFLVLLMGFIVLIDFFTGIGLDIEQLLLPHPEKLYSVPIGRMSPLTAANFLLTGMTLLLLLTSKAGRQRTKSAAAFLATIVFSVGLIILLGYLYGTPLLYGGTIIPVALTTAAAFVFLGFGFITAAGQEYWPVRAFTGSSVRAKLMRAFLPITSALILIQGWLNIVIFPLAKEYMLTSSLVAILSVTILTIAISKMAQVIGGDIDRTTVERERAEEKLRDASLYTRSLIEVSLDPLVTISPEGKIKDVNKATEQVTGVSREQLIGSDFSDYFTEPEKAREGYRQVFEKGFVKDYPLAIRHTSGSTIDVLYNAAVYKDAAGNVGGVFAAARDITERKLAEEIQRKLSSAVEHTADIVIIARKDGTIEYVNPAFEKITGYIMEEAVGKTPRILKSGKQDEKFYEHLWGTILSGEVFYGVLINKKNNGELYYAEKTITPVKDEDGTITHFVSTDKDITESKKAEEIRLENLRLEAADKAKSEFLANMSHELRTPLNSSIGFSELLKQDIGGELSEKQKHYVDNILASNQFLLTLINDILDLSKIEARKIELSPEKMSVPITVKETLSLIKEKAAKHNVLLKTEFDPKLEFIKADKQRFKQILFNLLSNAVKFSKEEGGTVTIRTKKEGDMAKISVSDTGIGIKEENIGRLFRKFEQLESEIGKKYGGTGLGLAITKQLVEMHGGKIWIESRFGEGSTFAFLLPLKG